MKLFETESPNYIKYKMLCSIQSIEDTFLSVRSLQVTHLLNGKMEKRSMMSSTMTARIGKIINHNI